MRGERATDSLFLPPLAAIFFLLSVDNCLIGAFEILCIGTKRPGREGREGEGASKKGGKVNKMAEKEGEGRV